MIKREYARLFLKAHVANARFTYAASRYNTRAIYVGEPVKRAISSLITLSAILFPTYAYAEGAGGQQQGNPLLSMLLFMVPLIFLFYFFIIRPEKKRRNEHTNMIASLQKGDTIITIAGIYGRIVEVRDDKLIVEVDDKVRLKMTPDAVARKLDPETES